MANESPECNQLKRMSVVAKSLTNHYLIAQ